MTTIDQLTPEQLTKSETLEKIRAMAHECIIYEQMPQAWELAIKLENKTRSLVDSSPEIYKQYQKIIAQLKFIAIPFQTDEQVLDLIEKHFLDSLKKIDAQKRIKIYWQMKSVFNQDQFRRDVLTHLKKNQQKIGPKTIGEWLLAYDQMAGARKNTSIERSKFITQNPDAKALSEEDKKLVSSLLEFYDYVKISVPLPYIGVSEITLKEYFRSLNIPLPGEEEKRIPLPKRPTPEKPTAEVKKKKLGFFKRLFGKKSKKPKKKPEKKPKLEKPEIPVPPKIKEISKEKPKKITPIYKGKISPYEKKREVPKTKEIPVTPKPLIEKEGPVRPSKANESVPIEKPKMKIRTMKSDIARLDSRQARQEKTKKRPIPPKPKTNNKIVDLSRK